MKRTAAARLAVLAVAASVLLAQGAVVLHEHGVPSAWNFASERVSSAPAEASLVAAPVECPVCETASQGRTALPHDRSPRLHASESGPDAAPPAPALRASPALASQRSRAPPLA